MPEKGANSKQPTVFVLYIPGGAMRGIIPCITLSRLESLTETPSSELFHVIEGVSTGSILAASLGLPEMTARESEKLYVELGPRFFPDIPGRWAKMHVRQTLNTVKAVFGLDPYYSDSRSLKLIEKLCDDMEEKTRALPGGSRALREHLRKFEKMALKKWLTTLNQKELLDVAQKIKDSAPELKELADSIAQLVATRTINTRLGAVFRRAAAGVIDFTRDALAPEKSCFYDTKEPKRVFQKIFGDRSLSDSACSLYISTYDAKNHRVHTFSSLKKNLFDKNPRALATIQNDIKLYDAVMASTANELAFETYITETSATPVLSSDKAPYHKPRAINDVLHAVPKGTKVVLVVAGTGQYISENLAEYIEKSERKEEKNLTPAALQRKELEDLRDRRKKFGLAGNILLGNEISEVEAYTSSDAMDHFEKLLGKENIFDFTPRLAPYSAEEEDSFPSRDILDASRDNMLKIVKMGRKLCRDEDEKIRGLAQMMADNLYLLGSMDSQKYARVCTKIGLKQPEPDVRLDEIDEKSRLSASGVAGIRQRAFGRETLDVLHDTWKKYVTWDTLSLRTIRQLFSSKANDNKPVSKAQDKNKKKEPRGPGGY